MKFVFSSSLSIAAAALLWLSSTTTVVQGQQLATIDYNCDPCLERRQYDIKAIVHGTSTDPVWQQIQAAAIQAASDMNINLDFQLQETFDLTKQAADITNFVDVDGGVDSVRSGLIVSIPNQDVSIAVKAAIDAGYPVVGINTGADYGKDIGVLDFVAPDDLMGGKLAGEMFLQEQQQSLSNVLYINDEQGNDAMAKRVTGLEQELGSEVSVQSLSVDGNNPTEMAADINGQLAGCSYQGVLLSGTRSLQATIDAYEANGCTISAQPLGVFDTTKEVYDAIGFDKLTFAISNNQWFQGAFGTVLASLAVTTGKSLAPSADNTYGAYLPGPKIITKSTLPSDTRKVCENDAFPVCPNDKAPDGSDSACPCTERKNIKIGGVTHGISTDAFWDPVYAASQQAAFDMGVELFNDRWSDDDDQGSDDLHTRMANRITKLCEQDDVDGIFVSIPSEVPIEAIQKCLDLNIPVISVNAGADHSVTLNLMHHIGMLEFNAGKGGGEFLIKSNDITHGLCINHAKGVNVVEERCGGYEAALEAAGIPYIGQVYVPDDNEAMYVQLVEEFVANSTLFDNDESWTGLGIIAAGGPQHIPVIALQARHEGTKIGAFDTSAELYDAVDAGIKEFGMDQQAYLQGYMPVVLLTYAATTGQTVSNQYIESGPAIIESSPSEEQQICEENHFETCEEEVAGPLVEDSGSSGSNDNTGLIIGLVVLAVVLLLAIIYFICRVNALNKHVAQLEAQGREVPPLTASQKWSALVHPVGSVVSGAAPAEPVSA